MGSGTSACRRLRGLLLLVGILAAAGCSGGSDQSSPGAVVEAAYRAVGEGDFTRACELFDPSARAAMQAFGTCESLLAEQYPPEDRRGFGDVEVDEEALDIAGDVVVVPDSAVTFGGEPSTDGPTTVVEREGRWWITV